MSTKPKNLLTTKQLPELTGLSTYFFEKRRVKNLPPAYIKLGGRVFYRLSDVEAWMESNRHLVEEGRS